MQSARRQVVRLQAGFLFHALLAINTTYMRSPNGEFWMLPKHIAERDDLTLLDKCVYAVLWTRRNGENVAWPSQSHVASALDASRQQVNVSIRNLVAANLVEKSRLGKRATNRYRLADGDVGKSDVTRPETRHQLSENPTSNRKRTYKRTRKEVVLKDGTKAVFHKGAWRPAYDLSKTVAPGYLPNV